MATPRATFTSVALIGLACFLLLASGCTHRQLARNTALTATTVTTIQYRMVLDNLAALSCQPGTLPAHVRLQDGTVQLTNESGFGNGGGLTTFGGSELGIDSVGPNVRMKVSEQWGTDAVTDPIQVFELQKLYRLALGLAPLPEPNFIAVGRGTGTEGSKEEDKKNEESDGRASRLFAEDFDVPIGWFGVGEKGDIPQNACYIGQHGSHYAWVTPHGVEGLARFTLAVATITKSDADIGDASSSLMVTP